MNASIQKIISVEKHPGADSLDIVGVLGYKCIVKRDSWKIGDLCVLIEPDTILPDKPWAAFYKARSSRIRAIKLRGVFSFGVVESITNVGYEGPIEEGLDISEAIGVTHYSAPEPQDLQAAGYYPFGIGRTDESRFQSIIGTKDMPPWGTLVDVSLKIDGCLRADTVLQTKSGPRTIKEIVDNKEEIKVLSFDCDTKRTVYSKVLNHSVKPSKKNWYEIVIEGGKKIQITGNHRVWLPKLQCYREVEKLTENDEFLVLI